MQSFKLIFKTVRQQKPSFKKALKSVRQKNHPLRKWAIPWNLVCYWHVKCDLWNWICDICLIIWKIISKQNFFHHSFAIFNHYSTSLSPLYFFTTLEQYFNQLKKNLSSPFQKLSPLCWHYFINVNNSFQTILWLFFLFLTILSKNVYHPFTTQMGSLQRHRE